MAERVLFDAANLVALIAWVLLIVFPRSRITSLVVLNWAASVALCCMYLIPAITLATPETYREFASLDGVMRFFSSPRGILAGWCHYLAVDLAVGVWMVRDSAGRLRGWVQGIVLFATYLAGPAGLLLYLGARRLGSLGSAREQG